MTPGLNEVDAFAEEPDARLLGSFATERCEAAFCELVRRHSAMIRATALRVCADASMADEITQNTLLLLARKARRIRIPEGGTIGGWLHRVAVLEARNACRKEQRRRRTMQKYSGEIHDADREEFDDSKWRAALPHLDHAINALSDNDRQLIVLRFLEEQPFRDIGLALGGLSPDAVRMKTKRVVRKLSRLLNRRGVGVPAAMVAAGLADLSTPQISAAAAFERSSELLPLASQLPTSGALPLGSFIASSWAVRIAVFFVGVSIPVAYSAFDRSSSHRSLSSNSPGAAAEQSHLPSPHLADAKRPRRSSKNALQRLLEQIAQLENEYQAPALLAEALELVMSLGQEHLPIVWETACAESPPQVLKDAIIIRWAELDPEGALAVCSKIDDGMKQGCIAIKVWYQSEPLEAAEHFRQCALDIFKRGKEHFWQTFALTDPGLGLQVNAELGGKDLPSQIYRYTLLQGWFQSQGLEFMTTHLQKRPAKFLPFNGQIMEKIEMMPTLNVEQLMGTMMWVAGIQKREDRLSYVDPLISKLASNDEEVFLEWVGDTPLLPEDLRARLLEHANLKQ